jgi:hypothetical protein
MSAGVQKRRRRRRNGFPVSALSLVVEALAVGRLGYPPAGSVVVRCRAGHLFTTIWVPGASIKSLRLGPWRVQWCPAGRHLSLVTPVSRAGLSRRRRRRADRTRDLRVP